MLKNVLKIFIIYITLFYAECNVYAYTYEYIDPENSTIIGDLITEIYDAKNQYQDLINGPQQEVEILDGTTSLYWWPVGSRETTSSNDKIYAKGDPETTGITSNFGYRPDPFGGEETTFHSGLDISGTVEAGETNIIAAKSGIVVYPSADVKNDCPSSNSLSNCGGGYGNYVIIQHSDGNYTLYGHLYQNSITVKAGDSVEQGQVIGKMGSSGNSTGTHLHFEVREGQNSSSVATDPLNYISAENPRSVFTGSKLLEWLNSWEGHTEIDGDCYIVKDIGDGVRTVGAGITLEYNSKMFKNYGIDVDNYPVESKIPISIVDQIELEIIDSKRSYIENILANNSITLKEHQIEALVSQIYNTGNIDGFVNAYQNYGNTQSLYDNWFYRNVMVGTQFEAGLTRRRKAEWSLFYSGNYVYNR